MPSALAEGSWLAGQREGEGRAPLRLGADVERAAVRLGDGPGDEQTEPRPRLRRARHVDAPELLEDACLLVARDSRPVVPDGDPDGPVRCRGRHADLPALRRI